MKINQLAEYWHKLEQVSGRIDMTEILAELFSQTSEEEIKPIIYLSLGQLGPKFDNPEFNMASKMVIRSISQAYDIDKKQVEKKYKQLGDLGEVAFQLHPEIEANSKSKSKSQQTSLIKSDEIKDKKLSVTEVYQKLLEIAKDSGEGSQDRKVASHANLIKSVDQLSAKYLTRIPIGKLRLGFSDMTILDGLSWMVSGDKSLHDELEDTYNVRADVGQLAQNIKKQNSKNKNTDQKTKTNKIIEKLKNTNIQPGTPVIAALCQRLKSFDEIIEKMEEIAIEPKYDGTRLQIHWSRNRHSSSAQDDQFFLRSYTRNLEENSHMFPELQELSNTLPEQVEALILDCEAIGYDPESEKLVPFQVTMTRKRKHNIEEQSRKVAIKFMIFDILYFKIKDSWKSLNKENNDQQTKQFKQGLDVHDWTLDKRYGLLQQIFSKINDGKIKTQKLNQEIADTKSILYLTSQTISTQAEKARELHHRYLSEGLEGVICKKTDSPYTPGRKGWHWVKMKEVEDAAAGLADTLDCVVMGYYRGRGQRTKLGMGAFLVGVVGAGSSSPQTSEVVGARFSRPKTSSGPKHQGGGTPPLLTVSKIGTGLTEDQFRDLAKRLKPLETKDQPSQYQVSKDLHPDVWVEPSLIVEIAADNITKSKNHTSGYGLRFPRLVKFRQDKSPDQATTIDEVMQLYKLHC